MKQQTKQTYLPLPHHLFYLKNECKMFQIGNTIAENFFLSITLFIPPPPPTRGFTRACIVSQLSPRVFQKCVVAVNVLVNMVVGNNRYWRPLDSTTCHPASFWRECRRQAAKFHHLAIGRGLNLLQ